MKCPVNRIASGSQGTPGVEGIRLEAGAEYLIPKGTVHAAEVVAGTRTIHAFGGAPGEPSDQTCAFLIALARLDGF